MKTLILLSTIIISFSSFSQNTGLYGKKFAIDVMSSGTMPLFQMLRTEKGYKNSGGQLVQKRKMINLGLRTGISYAVKNNIALGFEFGIESFSMAAPTSVPLFYPTNDPWYYYPTEMQHEMLDARTLIFMPRIEFTTFGGLLPIGLSHQIGVGISRTKILEKDYLYELYPTTNGFGELPDETQFSEKFYDYENDAAKGVSLMYTLNVRTPINKFMMISYGFRYNLNISGLGNTYYDDSGDYDEFGRPYYALSESSAKSLIQTHRLYSFIHLNLGVSFAL